jgi:hypothetical protein
MRVRERKGRKKKKGKNRRGKKKKENPIFHFFLLSVETPTNQQQPQPTTTTDNDRHSTVAAIVNHLLATHIFGFWFSLCFLWFDCNLVGGFWKIGNQQTTHDTLLFFQFKV